MENPKLIILDEPFNGIDNNTVNKIRKLLEKEKQQKIVIISSHIKEDIDLLADVVYEVDEGTVKAVRKEILNEK